MKRSEMLKILKTKNFKTFLIILAIGIISSTIPFGYLSMIFGFPAVLLNAILLSFIFKNKLYKGSEDETK